MLHFDEPVNFITGATPSVRKAWSALDISSIGDLLLTMPWRYDDFSRQVKIRDANHGDVVTVRGKVIKAGKQPSFRRNMQMMKVVIRDDTATLSATFFNQPWLLNEFTPERELIFSGKMSAHPRFGKFMSNPLWEPADKPTIAVGKLTPVYALTGTLAQKTYRRLIASALEHVEFPEEYLTPEIRQRWNLLDLAPALQAVHQPSSWKDVEEGRRRFAFEELLTHRLALSQAGQESVQAGAPSVPFNEPFAKKFVASLSFPLTDDQRRAMWTAVQDMQKTKPMRRLIQGDVGSGKTVIAAFLAAQAQHAGSSAVILAPTDILARQHAITLKRFLAPHHIPLLTVTRTERVWSLDGEEKTLNNAELENFVERGNVVLVGTHALLHGRRLPADLVLAIVDEQHRFGVDQREALSVQARSDGRVPHFLSMTATPIPRSLALTLYGDLDISVLRQKPAGRVPIKTKVCVGETREVAYQAIREAVTRGEQAFVVCPLIDPSDALGVSSVTEEWKRLSAGPLSGLRLSVLHGRLKPAEKDAIMGDFSSGKLDVLVSTSVIEVGIDVPKATIIAIEGAERFGLAQLHQLRGRVGRSHLASWCFLLTDAEGQGLSRLQTVERMADGFDLAEADLRTRGGGNLMGTEQSGRVSFKVARMDDFELMAAVREESERMLQDDASLKNYPVWAKRVETLRNTAHLE